MCRWLSHTSRAKNNLPSSMHRRPIDRRETIYLPRRWVIFSRLPRLPLGSVYKTENSLFFYYFGGQLIRNVEPALVFKEKEEEKKRSRESLVSSLFRESIHARVQASSRSRGFAWREEHLGCFVKKNNNSVNKISEKRSSSSLRRRSCWSRFTRAFTVCI